MIVLIFSIIIMFYIKCVNYWVKHNFYLFSMLKDPVKRIEQDEIWKKICAELHWEFIPTI